MGVGSNPTSDRFFFSSLVIAAFFFFHSWVSENALLHKKIFCTLTVSIYIFSLMNHHNCITSLMNTNYMHTGIYFSVTIHTV